MVYFKSTSHWKLITLNVFKIVDLMFMSSLKGGYTKNCCEKQYLYPLKLLCLKIGICNIELRLLFEPVVHIHVINWNHINGSRHIFFLQMLLNLKVNNNGCLMVGMIASSALGSSALIKDYIIGIYSSTAIY